MPTSSDRGFVVGEQLLRWMRDIRRHIHAHPEVSFHEYETSRYVTEKLMEIGVPFTAGHAGTGVVARLGGAGEEARGKTVALRADMDALPIAEETGLPFASTHPGVMHACGHDGHTAMLLGGAALLAERDPDIPVMCIFQPAEEHGNGAEKLVQENILGGVEAIFAGHLDTHLPTGVITVDEGIVCAWADPFQIRLQGRSGHAARPHQAVDTVVAASTLVMTVQTLISRGVDPNRAAVVTIGAMQAGTAQNIIAQDALLRGTVRSTHLQTRATTLEGLQRVVDSVGRMYGVEAALHFNDRIPAVDNDPRCAAAARQAAVKVAGVAEVGSQGVSSLGAEDFAFYQQKIPGCMVRFGAARNPAAGVSHSGTYDFDEDVLAIGAAWYAEVAWQWIHGERGGEQR